MGISMAVCEMDSDAASCKAGKSSIVKVKLKNLAGAESMAEYDLIVPMSDAKAALGADLEAILKRARIDAESESIYLEKVKAAPDLEKLKPMAKKVYTGWVVLPEGPERQKLIDASDPDDRLNRWDMLSFDDMNATCKACKLSWDDGRGCIGTFGPENSALPEIAAKNGARIVASVPKAVAEKKVFSVQEAQELLKEVALLREKLPDEGKMMVRRYSGVLDRLEKLANISIKYGARFYFF
jgi:hypothetical protein